MLIARRLWGSRAAVFAGLLVALQPNLISFSTAAITESLYSFLVMCALLLLLRGFDGRGMRAYAGAGALLGLAALVRPEAVAILVCFVLFAAAGRGEAGPAGARGERTGSAAGAPGERAGAAARARRTGLAVFWFAVTLIPYVLLLRAATGEWTGGSKAAVNLSSPVIWQDDLAREEYVYSLNAEGTARRIDDLARESAPRVLWRQRGAIASRYVPKLAAGAALLPLLFASPLLFVLVPLGLTGRRWRREDRAAEWLLLALGLFPFLFYSLFRVELRYLVPYLPVYLLWAGAGCGVLLDWFAARVTPRRAAAGALGALVLLSLVPYTINRYVSLAKSQSLEWREIGRRIAERESPAPRILAHSGCSVGYYAGNPEATFIPWTDAAGLIRYARHHRYEVLVVDEEYIRSARPTLRSILDDPPPELEPLNEFGSGSGGRILVYRIGPSS
jgi:4-amino-4-deoxy-L-arabinose transferase-like glycosyltransferase